MNYEVGDLVRYTDPRGGVFDAYVTDINPNPRYKEDDELYVELSRDRDDDWGDRLEVADEAHLTLLTKVRDLPPMVLPTVLDVVEQTQSGIFSGMGNLAVDEASREGENRLRIAGESSTGKRFVALITVSDLAAENL